MASVQPDLGVALQDHYRLDRELGHGGMATVWLAQDLKHGRPVALKILRPELAATLGPERFLREIQLTSRLTHPHILPLHDSGLIATTENERQPGLPYYTMPYVEGESLRARLVREKQLPIDEALQIAREVADALSYAHAHDVLHRDIKPENILLEGGHAVVADFGIAKALSAAANADDSSPGIALGTPAYMSPEQASGGQALDGRSDVYALGCVLYEMLAGQPPFTGPTAESVARQHIAAAVPSVRVVRPSVPQAVEDAITRALAKVPADRYASAVAFATGLAQAARPARWTARHTFGGVLVGLGLVVAGLWRLVLFPPPPLDPNKVVVFPLAESPTHGSEGTGEQVALLIGTALEHTEPLKWIDGWTWLDSDTRADITRLTARVERRIARAQGAAYYIDGSVVRQRDSITVVLRLNDAEGDSTVARTSSSSPTSTWDPPQLGLRAVTGILPHLLAPARQIDLTPLSSWRPAAVANWLQGEREYRLSHFETALEYCQRALAIDSSLAVAALRAAEAADWKNEPATALQLVDLALARVSQLPAKYLPFTRGLRAYLVGAADTAAAAFRLALSHDPSWADAWTALGEVHYHLMPQGTTGDSMAAVAFAQARRADPDAAPPLYHLVEIALRAGRLAEAGARMADIRRMTPDSTWLIPLMIMDDCVRRGAAAAGLQEQAERHPDELLQAAKSLSSSVPAHACARKGFRALLKADSENVRWGAVIGLQSLLVGEGAYVEAEQILDSALATGLRATMGLYLLDALAGAGMEDRAAQAVATLGNRYPEMSSRALWYRGLWAAHMGLTSQLDTMAGILTSRVRHDRESGDAPLVAGLAGHLALLRRDTAQAIAQLRRLAPVGTRVDIGWGMWESFAAERLLLGQLLLAEGDAAGALRLAQTFEHPGPILNLLYLPASLRLGIAAAAQLNRHDLASMYRLRIAQLEHPTS